MSKKFEEEYKEYLNAQAPDLWSRIEAGVDALEAGAAGKKKIVPITGDEAKEAKKKRRIRYQHYRAIVSVAACLFALLLIVPVYLLTRPSGKGSDNETAQAPMMLTDATIQNIEVTGDEYDDAVEEAPAAEEADDMTEMEVALEEGEEITSDLAYMTGKTAEDTLVDTDETAEEMNAQTESEATTQVAEEEPAAEEEEDVLPQAGDEESAAAQEDMQVTILETGLMQEGGVIYTAVVSGSTSSAPVSLFVPAESAIMFEAGKTYNITVELAEDGSHYVVVAVTEG